MTSSGRKLRAAGMGVRHANGAKGDLIAEVQVMLPAAAAPEAVSKLLDAAKAAQVGGADPRAALSW
jgi:DnaJ-class molecular chaperone